MKGLILKDLYTVRFQVIAGAVLMFLPNIMFLLSGSLDNSILDPDSQEIFSLVMYGILNFINICLFSSFVLNTLDADVNSGWAKIQRTFPVSDNQIIGAKLTATYIIVGILTLVSLAFNLAGALLYGLNMEIILIMPICIGLFQVLTLSPLFPLAMRIGTRFAGALYIITEIVMLALAVLLLVYTAKADFGGILLRVVFYGGIPVLAVVSAVLSYHSGKAAIQIC